MSWWISHVERTVAAEVPAPPDAVRDLYVDLDSLQVVHPLIVSVTELSRTDVPGGYRQSYRVVDRMRWGPITFRITYRAQWDVHDHGDVEFEAVQSPGVRLRGTVTFAPTATGTQVSERLHIAAPRLLAGYTAREAVKAHAGMLAAISSHFASRR
ncbi:SRPBCC family protein [Nocardioides sp. MAH-18]|uniref:SRPBCC family protein n=1 Tax=Nocardioides agri TaxID=2682843 RepID=A0A6L6XWF3_9ACTN|nr:SRPBCC family protein [Nocardioides sp. CGMCC 1.13656]MBA2952561.1 SRPBCC family protein [Nocardioides sp. CGMCC 1.13656]MVQ51724.1 SRPBCC family protein [Nocardioides sp. MAH-18]